jgi:hydroxymethylglutaryl-CoA lyase
MESGADAMRVVVCASETYNQRNVRMSVAESLQSCDEILKVGQSSAVPVEVAIGLAFGCPLEGHIPEDRVVELTGRLTAMGYQEVSIADSVGLGNPVQVQQMMRRLRREFPQIHFSLHLHNTRGLGLANVLAALGEGIDTFDSSIGGLGGCPVVPGGSGNIPTEDLVNMLEEMGIQTGVDIEAVTVASRMVQEFLQRPLPSYILSAGTRGQLFRRVGAPA